MNMHVSTLPLMGASLLMTSLIMVTMITILASLVRNLPDRNSDSRAVFQYVVFSILPFVLRVILATLLANEISHKLESNPFFDNFEFIKGIFYHICFDNFFVYSKLCNLINGIIPLFFLAILTLIQDFIIHSMVATKTLIKVYG